MADSAHRGIALFLTREAEESLKSGAICWITCMACSSVSNRKIWDILIGSHQRTPSC